MRWQEVSLDRREVRILAHTAKDDEDRILPMSARLLAVLDMARHDPAGHVFGPEAYVFGSAVEGRTKSVNVAWGTVCRKTGIRDLHFMTSDMRPGAAFSKPGGRCMRCNTCSAMPTSRRRAPT